ncbi:MAG TPA: hypothetical protein QGF35_09040, partial [Dehalococcoidia bacterium]|nr:hypothetical protein [Dehalococcoidia bacterium]
MTRLLWIRTAERTPPTCRESCDAVRLVFRILAARMGGIQQPRHSTLDVRRRQVVTPPEDEYLHVEGHENEGFFNDNL